jgi:hypothetical protein
MSVPMIFVSDRAAQAKVLGEKLGPPLPHSLPFHFPRRVHDAHGVVLHSETLQRGSEAGVQ